MNLDPHPAADLFPLMGADDFERLKDSITRHGQLEPIVSLHGQILDGRNRLAACVALGVEPKIIPFDQERHGDLDPVAFVMAANYARRHLSKSQLAIVAAKVRDRYAAEAKERQTRKPSAAEVENLPPQTGKARDQAGKLVGVSGRTVDHATKVLADGVPQLVTAVEVDGMAISKAARIAALPPDEQRDILAGKKPLDPPATKAAPPAAPPEAELPTATVAEERAPTQIETTPPVDPVNPLTDFINRLESLAVACLPKMDSVRWYAAEDRLQHLVDEIARREFTLQGRTIIPCDHAPASAGDQ